MQIFGLPTARMIFNQIPYVIFSCFVFRCNTLQCNDTYFLWNFLTETVYALDKKSPSMYNFQTFGCSNESSPNSSCHFWNHKVRVYLNFTSLFSVIKDNSSVFFFSLKPHILWAKTANWSEVFRLLSSWVKPHQIPHGNVIFETTSQFFFKLCITLQCHGR